MCLALKSKRPGTRLSRLLIPGFLADSFLVEAYQDVFAQYWGLGHDDGVAKGTRATLKFKNYFKRVFQNQ
jgi:hypothetical protein